MRGAPGEATIGLAGSKTAVTISALGEVCGTSGAQAPMMSNNPAVNRLRGMIPSTKRVMRRD